ncbi:ATP-dependent zinc metalloprotease FtsH [Myxococcota bacterium]|nr:ATP-dependent zinc metalloprotease FtsH [Myxococcota bacterium]
MPIVDPSNATNPSTGARKPQGLRPPVVIVLLLVGAAALSSVLTSASAPTRVPYSALVREVRAGNVVEARIDEDEIVARLTETATAAGARGTGAPPPRIVADRIPGFEDTALVAELERHGVEIIGDSASPSWLAGVFWAWVLPMAVISLLYVFAMRRFQGRGGPMSFGKNRAKLYDASQDQRVTFSDVAGVDEAVAEMSEVVDFLASPEKYHALGAKIPKGVLLVGPPGTGKTLMAKAVAGEARVPFFSMSGSDFVEMFVGVGAARVRDLFEQAKARSPCIIFIDEIDAIGRSRTGVGAIATHDEREQTLNQLLAEMDGFDPRQGVVIMAATNRPEVLDPALVRAGRFDRQVLIDRPSWDGRLAILQVHVRAMSLAPSVDLEIVARRTPGMVGADLARVANEAALAAARRGVSQIEQRDFEEAIDRIQLGLRKRGHVMNEAEKQRVAYHESGHALVALTVEHADPVHRVTIIPRTIGALGATLQLPTEDRYLMLKRELRDRICVMLGGRAAEELETGEVSTGAQNDLERATETARQMVTRFGMSESLGVQTFGRPASNMRYLDGPLGLGDEKNFSDETARAIDAEVRTIMETEHTRARQILARRKVLLDELAARLMRDETLEKADLDAIVAAHASIEEAPIAPPVPLGAPPRRRSAS